MIDPTVDILLIQPPIRDFYRTLKRTIPYGLACIASSLEAEGFSVSILDCLATSRSRPVERPPQMAYLREYYGRPDVSPFSLFHQFRHFGHSFEHVEKVVKEISPSLVGVSSLFTPYAREAEEVAERVKRACPRCLVVMGGHHPTALPREVMACRAVDFVVRGEGEAAMPLLARALKEGSSPDGVPGLVTRRADGCIHVGTPAYVPSLDKMPLPARHLINAAFYRRGRRGSSVVAASRGCPMKCSYCSLGAYSELPYRRRSVTSVLKEIRSAVELHGVRFIDFEDENLSLERTWFVELLQGIREHFGGEGLELRAMNGLFPPSLDAGLIGEMRESGFRALNLSLGTACRRQARRFRRPFMNDAFDAAVSACAGSGLEAVGYIIVGAPGQEPLDSLEDLLYLAERPVLAGVSIYYPSPGSSDFELCGTLGLLPESHSLMRATAVPVSHVTSREESITLLRLGRVLNFMKALLGGSSGMPNAPQGPVASPGGCEERVEVGRHLLSMFLRDGKIRGMTPEGEVYEHRVSAELCRGFLEGLEQRGVGPARREDRGESVPLKCFDGIGSP